MLQSSTNLPALPNGPTSPDVDETPLVNLSDLLTGLWRRKFLIVLGTLVGMALGAGYYMTAEPVYRSKAKLMVARKAPYNLGNVDARLLTYQGDTLSLHDTLIESPMFAAQAIAQGGLSGLASLAAEDEPAEAVLDGLSVSRETEEDTDSTNCILKFSWQGTNRDDCQTVLNAVVAQYQQHIRESSHDASGLDLVESNNAELERDLKTKQLAYHQLLETPPTGWNETGGTLQRERMAEIERRRSELAIQRAETTRQLNHLQQAIAQGITEDDLAAMTVQAEPEPVADSLEKVLFPLLLEEKTLLADYGAGHPDVQTVRERIRLARDFFHESTQARTQIINQAGNEQASNPTEVAKRYARTLEHELKSISDSEQALSELVASERQAMNEVAKYQERQHRLLAEIKRDEALRDTLVNRVHEAHLTRDLIGYDANLIEPPTVAKKVAPRLLLVIGIATFLGLQSGLGLALLAEARDKRFRNPQEIRGRLGLPIVGQVPTPALSRKARKSQPQGQPFDPVLGAHYRPNSAEAEAYRGIRASLFFNQNGQTPQVVQVTSPNQGDGKSALVANLAISVAQTGKQVLLIDGCMRNPSVHRLFGASAETGMTSYLAGDAEFGDVVVSSGIPGLSLMPCGPLPGNAADLIASTAFHALLDEARGQYDLVLIDTPALLTVTDPRLVAGLVDGVLLAIRVSSNDRSQAEQAKEILETIDTRLLGVVVNAGDHWRSKASYSEPTATPAGIVAGQG